MTAALLTTNAFSRTGQTTKQRLGGDSVCSTVGTVRARGPGRRSRAVPRRQSLTDLLATDAYYRMAMDTPGLIMELGVHYGRHIALLTAPRGVYEPYDPIGTSSASTRSTASQASRASTN